MYVLVRDNVIGLDPGTRCDTAGSVNQRDVRADVQIAGAAVEA